MKFRYNRFMVKKRFDDIDVLKALGIIAVIAIHVLTYNLSSPVSKFLWNYLQFFVVTFIFSSGFVLSAIYGDFFTNLSKTFTWYKKRVFRIALPFWIYLLLHYGLLLLFPGFFSGL